MRQVYSEGECSWSCLYVAWRESKSVEAGKVRSGSRKERLARALGYPLACMPAPPTFEFRVFSNLLIDHHLRPASTDSVATVKMLIPKADRKKIHELVLLYNAYAQRNRDWNFARNRPIPR